ncbi:hypothetical protein ACSBOX_17700 [Arthrobacter sp. KN11-1C]
MTWPNGPNNQTATYSYDANDRLTQIRFGTWGAQNRALTKTVEGLEYS